MTRRPDKPEQPHRTPRTQAKKAARQERLAEAMRKNLLRRKQRARAQQDTARKDDD